jgi:hypothetical protein
MSSLPGGLSCSIARDPTLAGDLLADAQGSACEPGGYGAHRFPSNQRAGDPLALGKRQSQLRAATLSRSNPARFGEELAQKGLHPLGGTLRSNITEYGQLYRNACELRNHDLEKLTSLKKDLVALHAEKKKPWLESSRRLSCLTVRIARCKP